MSKKIMLINADHPEECRAVLLEDGKVEDLIVEHASHEQIKGNIYLGTINRVEPAIEAAFMDFGGKKFGFLPFKDVRRDSYIQTGEKKARVRIQDVLVRGQKLLLQVVKEGRDAKGPSLTNWISLPGRFLVLMCGQEASAISRKIEDESERKKLKEIISDFELPENTGVIIRTAGLGRTKAELQKDLQMLLKIWETIQETIEKEGDNAPFLVYKEPDLVVRTVRDHFTTDTSEIVVDTVEAYRAIKDFVKLVMPRLQRRVKLYQETQPLFSHYKVEEQLESIYNRKVLLPSGGSVVVDIGEAMVSIDVNSGKTTSASQLEETATKTNLEAADEIARQLRLRDLGGLIVIDFIDMFQKKNKTQVEKRLKLGTKKDKARINISRISKFGLLEMSRQRMSPPVKEGVYEECSQCHGSGHVKSTGSMVLGVIRKIRETLAKEKARLVETMVSPEVCTYLLNHKLDFLKELQEKNQFELRFVTKPGLCYDDFTYQVLERKEADEARVNGKAREARTGAQAERRSGSRAEKADDSGRETKEKEERGNGKSESDGARGRRAKTSSRGRNTRRKSSSTKRTSSRTSSGNRRPRRRSPRSDSPAAENKAADAETAGDSAEAPKPAAAEESFTVGPTLPMVTSPEGPEPGNEAPPAFNEDPLL